MGKYCMGNRHLKLSNTAHPSLVMNHSHFVYCWMIAKLLLACEYCSRKRSERLLLNQTALCSPCKLIFTTCKITKSILKALVAMGYKLSKSKAKEKVMTDLKTFLLTSLNRHRVRGLERNNPSLSIDCQLKSLMSWGVKGGKVITKSYHTRTSLDNRWCHVSPRASYQTITHMHRHEGIKPHGVYTLLNRVFLLWLPHLINQSIYVCSHSAYTYISVSVSPINTVSPCLWIWAGGDHGFHMPYRNIDHPGLSRSDGTNKVSIPCVSVWLIIAVCHYQLYF